MRPLTLCVALALSLAAVVVLAVAGACCRDIVGLIVRKVKAGRQSRPSMYAQLAVVSLWKGRVEAAQLLDIRRG